MSTPINGGGPLTAAAMKRRMDYNIETTSRFSGLKARLSIAQRLEKSGEWKEAEAELGKLVIETGALRLHLNAWEQYKP